MKKTLTIAGKEYGTVWLAPMAGMGDAAFRRICKEHGADYMTTEMVSAKALCYGDKKTPMLAAIRDYESPVAIQLFGSEPETMAKASEMSGGAMAAILRSDNETIEKVLKEVNGFVAPANYNSPEQTVIAGEAAAVDEAIEKLSALKARCVKLAVSAAFHTKLMNSAAEEFKAASAGLDFKAPSCDFYSNVYGKKLTDFSDMPSYLASHICSPVKFVDEMNEMNNAGIEAYVELGPNKVLTGLVKKTFKGANAVNIENCETLEKALGALNS